MITPGYYKDNFMPKALTKYYEYNEVPPFRINAIRMKYRNIFIKMINSGEIELEEIKSCACGNTDYINISNNDRFALPFRTIACKKCGLVITNPRISEYSLSKYYKEIYYPLVVGAKNGEIMHYPVSEIQGENIYNYVEEIMFDKNNLVFDICEIGCATGSNLIDFAKLANIKGIKCNLYGTEYEERYANIAQQRGIFIIPGDIDNITNYRVKFDLIILSHVFEHLIDLNKALAHIRDALKPEGIVYIEVPGLMNEKMMQEWYGGDYKDYCVHAHTYNFNLSSLNFILNSNGFKQIKCNEAIQAVYEYDPNHNEIPKSQDNYEVIINHLVQMSNKAMIRQRSPQVYLKKAIWKLYYRYWQARVDFSKFKGN